MKQSAVVGSNQKGKDTGNDDGAVNFQQSRHRRRRRFADGNHRGYGSEGNPLNERQPHPHVLEANGLDNRGDTAREQVCADQRHRLFLGESNGR